MTSPAQRLTDTLRDPRAERAALLAVLVLAVLVRLAFAALLPDQSQALGDAATYRMAAVDIMAHRFTANEYVMPGYPLLVALTRPGIGQLPADIELSATSVWCAWSIARDITATG